MQDRAATYKRLTEALPDIPRWLETRSMLLDGEGELLGLTEKPLAFVVRDPASGLICIVGRPAAEAIHEALYRNGDDGEIVCQLEDEAYVAPFVPNWRSLPATLHLLSDSSLLPGPAPGAVTFVHLSDLESADEIPEHLLAELRGALLFSHVAAALVDGKPVAFCYSGSETETLWDISIDTLEPYRRLGYASLAVAHMIDYMWRDRRRPVWGAEESNAASMGLARKLGFSPVDRLVVLRDPA